jgi:uncharacterized membrane protein (UPF0127 family)
MTNDERRQILNRAKQLGYPGSILDVFQAYSQGVDVLSDFEREQRAQQIQARQAQQPIVAQTPEEQSQGLIPFHQAGQTDQSMVFPNVKPGQPFTTQGLTAPIDMTKVDNQGNVVESYKAVQPGIANIPTGPYEGTMIETPAKSYLKGGFSKKYQIAGVKDEKDGPRIENLPTQDSPTTLPPNLSPDLETVNEKLRIYDRIKEIQSEAATNPIKAYSLYKEAGELIQYFKTKYPDDDKTLATIDLNSKFVARQLMEAPIKVSKSVRAIDTSNDLEQYSKDYSKAKKTENETIQNLRGVKDKNTLLPAQDIKAKTKEYGTYLKGGLKAKVGYNKLGYKK